MDTATVLGVSCTPSAAERIKQQLAPICATISLRISVKPKDGIRLAVNLVPCVDPSEADHVFCSEGVNLVVDKEEVYYLSGMVLDYVVQSSEESGFILRERKALELAPVAVCKKNKCSARLPGVTKRSPPHPLTASGNKPPRQFYW